MEKNLENRILENIANQYHDIVKNAIQFTTQYHKEELRYSGEKKIKHLLHVALLTTTTHMDTISTISALLHEIPLEKENTDQIQEKFGLEVLQILKKIKDIKKSTDSIETPNEIIIKYILGSSKDLRPVIIKILDCVDDIHTIEKVPEEKKKIALSKALNIYSVLAEYLNLNSIKKEIEENAFREYLPVEYTSITNKLEEEKIDNKLYNKYKEKIWESIKNLPFKKNVEGRIKCKYSIYNKLKKHEKEWKSPNITELNDLIAFRITTDTEDNCLKILEKLMDLGKIDEKNFDDYISNPKPNGYKAIQFPISIPEISDLEIEIQILTEEMAYFNTHGPASHIAYKASKSRYAKPTNKYNWVEKIYIQLEKNKKERNYKLSLPIKCNIYEDEAFVFTPKGKILDMDKGDTALDYAFKLHTQIGNSAVSAEINGKPSKISSILNTGDIVEIKTDKSKKCQKIEALRQANSLSTRFRIRNQLSKFNRKE